MKNLFLLFLFALLIVGGKTVAQTDGGQKSAKSASKKATRDSVAQDTSKAANAGLAVPMMKNPKDTASKACGCVPKEHAEPLGTGGWFLVFIPVFIFLLIGAFSLKSLRGFNVKDALSENVGAVVTERNELYTKEHLESLAKSLTPQNAGNDALGAATFANVKMLVPPTLDVTPLSNGQPIFRPSISRFIALISAWVIIAVVVSMSSLFIYEYIAYGCPPDFSSLTIVLITLGLGIVPYAVNKVANAAADKDKII